MVYERVTGGVREASVHAQPDKRWLGALLCAASAMLTLALGGLIAESILTRGESTIATGDLQAPERFQPASGRTFDD